MNNGIANSNKPSVDILTIAFDQEKYIGQCIESVIAQTYDNWRMIIVDDGSSDRTCDMVNAYNDSRIMLISLPHRGIECLKESYGLALAQSCGELLAILDGDDWWPPNKLEIEIAAFQNPKVVMAFGSVIIFNEKTKSVKNLRLPKFSTGLREGNAVIRKILNEYYFPYSVTTMLRRSALVALGGFVQPENLPLVDLPTWMNLLPNAQCFGFEEILGYYRVHDKSVCRMKSAIIDRQQMNYNEEYLDNNWEKIGLVEKSLPAYRKKIHSYHDHRRGVLCMLEKNWSESKFYFKKSFNGGKLDRKAKTFVRLIQLLLQKFISRISTYNRN